MGKLNSLLIILGTILISIASFAFSTQATPMFPTPSNDPTNDFQIILGIAGLSAIIFGIVKE
ncbi:MAG: hypothetical protein KJ600_02570 [Nanoarchaeota archaeon]|nr:hypothetical protein [Nanoarchaeota archaeon]MBU1103417.1 hypothetical protein [Nanoarchaeota archaeon]